MSTLQGRRSAARISFLDSAGDAPRRLAILWAALTEWRRRARGRRELAQLPDRELRDIGLTRDDVMRECSKPFWRG